MRKSVKNRTIYTVLLLICLVGFWLFENFYTPDTYTSPDGQSIQTDMPSYVLPTSTTGAIVNHDYYSLSYNEPFEQAEWVAYPLEKKHLTYDDRKRPYFIEDPKVKTKSADWRNYKGSGYDRGHLCPAGDRRFSEYAYNETFYTSNISPQNREFNAGVWNQLEIKTRQWVKKNGTHFIITGGVLESGLDEIGEEGVDVPRYYYKIIAKGSSKDLKAIAFLMQNRPSNKSIKQFVVSIDEIEKRTGIDFFSELPDEAEDKLESKIRIQNWKF
ncbi:DNA/RNA non-specific endonuclease [Maribacter algarum]|uniref:Endonuclease n=1 Tax=Maribacter algarum (ex Zhang et al. 2020) TaxID=2578118 RepID=A0A5S3PX45_9FLAO|nr:DNA/RNA non-specific endonuclease [Maribacter algarum]TMM59488.1 DNA/RNA non-specific endonuclease [Maribacter algarum]